MTRLTIEHARLDGVITRHIERVLHLTNRNQSQAARVLDLPLSTLRSKMKRLGIETRGQKRAAAADGSAGHVISVESQSSVEG